MAISYNIFSLVNSLEYDGVYTLVGPNLFSSGEMDACKDGCIYHRSYSFLCCYWRGVSTVPAGPHCNLGDPYDPLPLEN